MKKILFLILLIVVFAACTNHESAKTNTKSTTLRLVSLAPSVTRELQELGLDSNIVGATSYCTITKNRAELIIGNATDINIEKVLLLKPDMVLTTALTRSETIEMLRKSGIKVHCFGKIESYAALCSQFTELGKLVQKEKLANELVAQSKHRIDSLKNLIPAQTIKPKLFFQIGAKPIFAVIPKTYMDDLIIFSGCRNIATDMNRGTISRESVLLRNPDIMIITTMGIMGEDEIKVWQGYPSLNAMKQKKIFIIDSDKACTPTLKSFEETLAEMINLIY
jgi:ABC-type Fe3+-hydroxamate transport system substrate-binding protein